jgi:ABC-2 type transport system ATP-binding protein
MSVAAIEVEDLHRSFGKVKAVNGVSFRIEQGSVTGFIGANGAGKTTTMRILSTLDYADGGEARVMGHDVLNAAPDVRQLLGWMPDTLGAYSNVTVTEYLDFFARAFGFRGDDRAERVHDVLDFVEMAPLAERMTDKLSKGQGQRLCFARALLNDPRVLILDEPAAGLDPKARVELKRLIRVLADQGATILISSHILSELSEMCNQMLFINDGRIVHHGDAETMRRGSGTEARVFVRLYENVKAAEEWVVTDPDAVLLETTTEGVRLNVTDSRPEVIAGVLRRMVQAKLAVTEFRVEERKLEDAFMEMLDGPAIPPPPTSSSVAQNETAV